MLPQESETDYQYSEYDERQKLVRYKTGYQAFLLLCVLLVLDGLLHEMTSLRWGIPLIRYTMMFGLCMIYFVSVCIWRDAYHAKFFSSLPWILTGIIFDLLYIFLIILLLKQGAPSILTAEHTLGYGALYIMIAVFYSLTVLNQLAKYLVDRYQDYWNAQ